MASLWVGDIIFVRLCGLERASWFAVEQHLIAWLVRYGAPVIFVAQLLGIFGLPIPDELLLTVAGALVRRGTLPGTPIVISAVAGCLAGITISFVLGRVVGLPTLRRRLHVHEETLHRADEWFCRFGRWLLAFGYFIPGVRHVTAIAAGSTTMRYSTFALYAYAGGALWSILFVGLGFYAGDRWREVIATARAHLVIIALMAALAGVAYAMRSVISARRA